MEIRVLNKTRNELKIEVAGEGHTLCNLIQKALLKDKRVDIAGYDVSHPLTSKPRIYVRTKARSRPETVFRDAVLEVQKDSKSFRLAFEKAFKRGEVEEPS
jgi:DNA-directed RNA polymerase subunit L